MADDPHDILILEQRIDRETLRRLAQGGFGEMVNMEIADPVLRGRMFALAHGLIGGGEEL